MKITVINGSPKGESGITVQSARYLEKRYGEEIEYLHVGKKIRAYETKDELIADAIDKMKSADLVLVVFPVYTMLATAQLVRFFELLTKTDVSLSGVNVSIITTSMRFYDVTALQQVKDILSDFECNFFDGISMDMQGLLDQKGREELEGWYEMLKFSLGNNNFVKLNKKISKDVDEYHSNVRQKDKTGNKKIALVTDGMSGNLGEMIKSFKLQSKNVVDIFDISLFPFKCSCLGCLKCTAHAHCMVKDGFEEYLAKINSYDSIVHAFTIQNHSMSSNMKTYFDRQFVNGHRPVNTYKPTGNIVSGALSEEPNLQVYLTARAGIGENFVAGCASDEFDPNKDIKSLAENLDFLLDSGVKPAKTFYQVGGMKIFRDMIYEMRGLMSEDYRFYKQENLLDFPQKRKGKVLLSYFIGWASRSKFVAKKMGANFMAQGMLMPFEKLLEKVEKK